MEKVIVLYKLQVVRVSKYCPDRDIESERDVDFRHLTLDDVEILRTYLTPDQKKVLEDVEKTPGFDQTFLEQSNARFARIVSMCVCVCVCVCVWCVCT